MRLLRRRTPERKSSPTPPFSADETKRIDAVWRLTALPRDEFDVTYGGVFGRAWSYGSACRGLDWEAVKAEILNGVTAALRARQARIVPRFAAAEDSGRLQEVMSFALAVSVVAELLGRVAAQCTARSWRPWAEPLPADAALERTATPDAFGWILMPYLAGEAGQAWLAQEPVARREMAAYFSAGPSELRDIVDAAAAAMSVARGEASVDEIAKNGRPEPEKGGSGVGNGPLRSPGIEKRGESPADFAPEAGETVENVEKAESEAVEAAPAGEEEVSGRVAERPPIGTDAAGWRWINWVRRGLDEGSVPLNEGWLYNVDGDAFMVVPYCFARYCEETALEWKTVKNQVTRLRKHRPRVHESRAASLHKAVLPGAPKRKQTAGLLFPGDLFWDDEEPPRSEAAVRLVG